MNMKKIKNNIISLFLLMGLLAPIALPVSVGAQISPEAKDAACKGIGDTDQSSCNDNSAGTTVSGLVSTVVNIFSWIVGIVAVIMIIVGGFKFITSGGDSNGVASARSTIIYSLVGLAVAALSQMLVQFVLEKI